MIIRPLAIPGALEITPKIFPDGRGLFYEEFRADLLAEQIGHRPEIVQTNVSVSARGVLRGIHFADVPPSQAKYVTALTGALLDYIVDLRVGSPSFGRWESVLLDTDTRRAVYLPEGVGHAFAALADETTAMYLVTAPYAPEREHGIDPLDPEIGLRLPDGFGEPVLSAKDTAAPSLAEALASGSLPTYAACTDFARQLRDRSVRAGFAPAGPVSMEPASLDGPTESGSVELRSAEPGSARPGVGMSGR